MRDDEQEIDTILNFIIDLDIYIYIVFIVIIPRLISI